MALTLDEVKRIAQLARIEVAPDEAGEVLARMTGILRLIEAMQAVDTTGVVPMSHAQDVMLRLRDDVVTESDQHALFQNIAPQVEADLYLVPRVIE